MKISVVIPVYNAEDCLERCVRSCMAQTYSDIEIIIVDDGSTDATSGIADILSAEDDRVRVFHQSNGGSSYARNTGIKNASGEYIGFVDADDYIEPDMYEKLARAVVDHDLKIAQICRDELAPDGTRLLMVVAPPDAYTEIYSEDFLRELLLHKGDCSFCTKLTSREMFDVALFPEGELNEDFRLFTILLEYTDRVGVLPDVGYHVCYREGSNTRTTDGSFSRVFTDIVVNADRVSEMVADRHPNLTEYAERFALVQRLDYMLHIPVGLMKDSDDFYVGVKKYLRGHMRDIISNSYLDGEQRRKLILLTVAPKLVRYAHLWLMRLRHIVNH